MKWERVRVGDLIDADGDLLLVVEATPERLRLLTLDDASGLLTGAVVGVVETWEAADGEWAAVVGTARIAIASP